MCKQSLHKTSKHVYLGYNIGERPWWWITHRAGFTNRFRCNIRSSSSSGSRLNGIWSWSRRNKICTRCWSIIKLDVHWIRIGWLTNSGTNVSYHILPLWCFTTNTAFPLNLGLSPFGPRPLLHLESYKGIPTLWGSFSINIFKITITFTFLWRAVHNTASGHTGAAMARRIQWNRLFLIFLRCIFLYHS